jgi:hypothetical protein
MLYRSTDRLCRRGAPVENLPHVLSLSIASESVPSYSGTEHLGPHRAALPGGASACLGGSSRVAPDRFRSRETRNLGISGVRERSALTPRSGDHDEEHRRRMYPSGLDFHGLACLRQKDDFAGTGA